MSLGHGVSAHNLLELEEYMFAGGHDEESGAKNPSPKDTKKGEKTSKEKPYASPFSSGDVLTVGAMIAQMWLLGTSFFTDSINAAILEEYSGEEVLGIMFLSVFLWFSVAPVLRRIAVSVPAEGIGWKEMWVMAVDFMSRIILLLTFGYAAIFLKTMWFRSGLILVEILFITAVLALYGFGFYAIILKWAQLKTKMEKTGITEDYNPIS